MKNMMKILKLILVGLLAAPAAQAGVPSVWDDNFAEASLNTNLTIRTAGGAVVQTNGTLQMSTDAGNEVYRAMVYTTAGQTGKTTYLGNPVYDYNAHTVSTRFDFNSNNMTNLSGAFWVSMGELTIDATQISTYTGFSIQFLPSAGTSYLRAKEFSNGDKIKDNLIQLSTGEVTAFGFDVTGTNVALWVEGDTFAAGGTNYLWTMTQPNTPSSYHFAFGARGTATDTYAEVVLD
jgi:hypothetical protein